MGKREFTDYIANSVAGTLAERSGPIGGELPADDDDPNDRGPAARPAQPWLQLPGESARNYERFTQWLDSGVRSHIEGLPPQRKTPAAFYAEDLKRSARTGANVAGQFQWLARAAAYDAQHADPDQQLRRRAVRAASAVLQDLEQRLADGKDAVNPNEAATMIKVALAAAGPQGEGHPAAPAAIARDGKPWDLSLLNIDELQFLDVLRKVARKEPLPAGATAPERPTKAQLRAVACARDPSTASQLRRCADAVPCPPDMDPYCWSKGLAVPLAELARMSAAPQNEHLRPVRDPERALYRSLQLKHSGCEV